MVLAAALAGVFSVDASQPVRGGGFGTDDGEEAVVLSVKRPLSAAGFEGCMPDGAGRGDRAVTKGAGGIADFNGSYIWSGSPFNSMGSKREMLMTVDNATGEARIAFVNGWFLDAKVNFERQTLTIPTMQVIGEDEDGDVVFYMKDIGPDGKLVPGANSAVASVGTVTGTTIKFPEMDVWVIGNPDNEAAGFYWGSAYNELTYNTVQTGGDVNRGWTSLGNATFMDGWVLPCVDIDQHDEANWYEVELQQYDADKNLFRLVDPYWGDCPAAEHNHSTAAHGYIMFDVTDPEHVVFSQVDAGFANVPMGISRFYCMNQLSTLMGIYNMSAQTVISQMGNHIAYTTFKDGVVSLEAGKKANGYDNDACFGIQNDVFGRYCWTDESDNNMDMTTRIIFPDSYGGIGSVTAEKRCDAPVEYYTLQGVRVAAPAAGQILIRRQGADVSKVVVR